MEHVEQMVADALLFDSVDEMLTAIAEGDLDTAAVLALAYQRAA